MAKDNLSKNDREFLLKAYYNMTLIGTNTGTESVADLIEKAEAGDKEAKASLEKVFDEKTLKRLSKNFKDLRKVIEEITEELKDCPEEVTVVKPTNFITPVDKVSSRAFKGKLNSPNLLPVPIQKDIDTMVSINFDEAQAQGVAIMGRHELTAYDREIHDAITSLYVDGGNKFITTNMIYRTITGDTDKHRGVSEMATKAINESVTKLMYSRIIIDATAEARALNKNVSLYNKDSALLPAKRTTAIINGQRQDCIEILTTPPLYEYAEEKKQIGRVELKLLDSPIRKNEDVIKIQGYLMRRVLCIKNNIKVHPTITYDSLYNQLEIEATTAGALRQKRLKIKKQAKQILDYWIDEKFIKGYEENEQGLTIIF